jgi:hypothetical protein
MNSPTFQIIYLVQYHDAVPIHNMGTSLEVFREYSRHITAYREEMEKNSEDQWNETKQMAIKYLKHCSAFDHNKTLGTRFYRGQNGGDLGWE